MSGIVGIVNLKDGFQGAPVDCDLLRRMTDSMVFRGPDAQAIWHCGSVGLGHTLLRTTDEAASEQQPLSFDDKVWIVADARIDDRENLLRELKTKGLGTSLDQPDVELILDAYLAWGESCVEHLLGDFAFAIWDERQRKLFCARDHFGIKPFFYAQTNDALIFSNTLDCVRLHPAVSDELDDLFIADFLLFESSQQEDATAFADIRRLPPAHSLTYSTDGLQVRPYWTLPEYDLVYYKRPGEYVEQFNELFSQAVADRLRTSNVAVQMSGGLDSTAAAAIAHRLLRQRNADFDLRAYTVIFKRLFADDEGHYAQMVADDLRIPISYQVADDYEPFAHFTRPEVRMPEPWNEPAMAMAYDQYQEMAGNSRVVLTGTDGDTVLSEWSKPYFNCLFKQGQFGKLLSGMWWYVRVKRQLPRIGFRYGLRQWLKPESWNYEMPAWVNQDFARRLDLVGRLRQINEKRQKHPLRPRAYGVLRSPMFTQVLEPCDPGITFAPIEWRHPFADLRLVSFLLSTPPVPWLVEKELLKQAMHGILPEAVIQRPKTTLAIDPLIEELRQGNTEWTGKAVNPSVISRYVECSRIGSLKDETGISTLWENLRPLSLNHWLVNLTSINHKLRGEVKNESREEYAAAN